MCAPILSSDWWFPGLPTVLYWEEYSPNCLTVVDSWLRPDALFGLPLLTFLLTCFVSKLLVLLSTKGFKTFLTICQTYYILIYYLSLRCWCCKDFSIFSYLLFPLAVLFCCGGVSLCSPSCPGTLHVNWTGLEFTEVHLSLPPEYFY